MSSAEREQIMDTYQIEIIEPKAKRLLDELVKLNLIKFQRIESAPKVPTKRADDLQALLKATQSLPQAQAISEEEIAAEIAAYREGK